MLDILRGSATTNHTMKYSFAELSVKTLRLHETSTIIADKPSHIREMWEKYVTSSEWYDENKEAVVVFLMNTKLKCVGFHLVSLGSLNESVAHPREIFRPAVAAAAHSIALAHNHPSGDPTPSDGDRRVTRRVREAAEIMGIHLLDHVVIGDGQHFSFREHGML